MQRAIQRTSPARAVYRRLRSEILLRGSDVECPCCNGRFKRMLTAGDPPRPGARCPRCDSLERHRILALYAAAVGIGGKSVVHVAPEPCLTPLFAGAARYVSFDLSSPLALVHGDIVRMPMREESFDLAVCSHVLEHIPDDIQAMASLFRLLVPGGRLIAQVPLDRDTPATVEDPDETDPAERKRRFGQEDHVRVYGMDIVARLASVGFEVTVIDHAATLGDGSGRYNVGTSRLLFDCRRPGPVEV